MSSTKIIHRSNKEEERVIPLLRLSYADFLEFDDNGRETESPDWQSKNLNMGIEVVSALDTQAGQLIGISDRVGQAASFSEAVKKLDQEDKKNVSPIAVLETSMGIATNLPNEKMPSCLEIERAINNKTVLLNEAHFTRFAKNTLFIYADKVNFYVERDGTRLAAKLDSLMRRVVKKIREKAPIKSIVFDEYYIITENDGLLFTYDSQGRRVSFYEHNKQHIETIQITNLYKH